MLIYKYSFLIIFTVLILLSIFFLTAGQDINGDEFFHFRQIKLLLTGDYRLEPYLTVIPGFHLVIAVFAKISNITTLTGLRFFNFIFGLLSVGVFFLTVNHIDKKTAALKTLLFVFLPFLFPYRYLLYTENLSILFLLMANLALLKRKYFLSGVSITFSVFVRQTNIIWLIPFLLLAYFQEKRNISITNMLQFSSYILSFVLFTIFLFINRGLALGVTRNAHPLTFHLGNVYWFLFSFSVIFFPYLWSKAVSFNKNIMYRDILFPTVIFITVGTVTYVDFHPWNLSADYMRNLLLILIKNNVVLRGVYFIVVTCAIIVLSQTQLHKKLFYLIFLAGFVALSTSSLVEPRYSILSFTFFLVMWKQNNTKILHYCLIVNIILSLIAAKLVLLDYFHL